MTKRSTSEQQSTAPAIPTEADWGNYKDDLDQKWAHDQCCGRSNEELQKYFRKSPMAAAEDLHSMPEIPFRYYMLGYRDAVMSGDIAETYTPDAASWFLNLVEQKLKEQPRYIVPIMPDLIAAVEYVADNQSKFQADKKIYGDFLEQRERIRSLYAESRDRYRRYR